MHSTKPVPRRDVGEVAGGQVAVGSEAELLSEAESSLACRMALVDDPVADGGIDLLPGFNFDTTSYALQEGESGRFWGRLSLVELEGCESGAFVDGVAEDEWLLFPWSASCNMIRQRIAIADCVNAYHLSH